ncbi:cysteine desulfurase [Radiobacillus kanasensis]|uniref:cysteine desulfurase family protein n=1 Tax=Radiobacillus kanasensis TaxID=2844358 RepID=UPI001E650838|nr:cysteine desulfurase family protein [Radiobacillus kanasensis]UFT98039.1 cysteine desulfurase [Radiobacillus kanasensis]
MIYLDNSATTKPYKEVLDSFHQVSTTYFGNPSSIHQLGTEAEQLLSAAKRQAAQLLQVKEEEIVFTSGGTEGNNTAIKGIAYEHVNRGKHIITSRIEHPSVLETCKALEGQGYDVTYLPVDEVGRVSVSDLEKAIRSDTILVTIMHVNNEIGTIQPIEEIAEVCSRYPKLYFHVDHVQGLGKVPLSLEKIDLCTMSGHKIHGLKGTGVLYIRKNISLFPLLHGGEQEFGYRSGTENLPGAVSFVKALRMTLEKQSQDKGKLADIRQALSEKLRDMEGVILHDSEHHAPHILNFSLPGFKPEVVIHAIEKEGFIISTKSACSSKNKDESAVLAACGLPKDRTTSALRVSLSYSNTMEEIHSFSLAFQSVKQQLSKVMG